MMMDFGGGRGPGVTDMKRSSAEIRRYELWVCMSIAVAFAAGCSGSDRNDDGAGTGGQAAFSPVVGTGGVGQPAASGLPMPGMTVMNPPDAGSSTGGSPAISGAGGTGGQPAMEMGTGGASEIADAGHPMMGTGGMPGDAGGPDAGDASVGTSEDEDECGAIPTEPIMGGASAGKISGAATIEYDVEPPNEFTSLRTMMVVPAEPPPTGVIFLWPGLQPLPSGKNYQPIGNGVLQPVLTWGQSCAPGAPSGHDTWWISPVYVNVTSFDSNFRGCHGGPVVLTEVGDQLQMDITLDGTQWLQKVIDVDTKKSTEYTLDLQGQAQGRAFFVIELQTNAKPTEDIVFTKSVLTMAMPQPEACTPLRMGMRDYASKARVSADGKHCCIDRVVLRADGVMATTMDP